MFQNAEIEDEHADERSVDDLLSFINGNDGGNLTISVVFCRNFINDVMVHLY